MATTNGGSDVDPEGEELRKRAAELIRGLADEAAALVHRKSTTTCGHEGTDERELTAALRARGLLVDAYMLLDQGDMPLSEDDE